MNYDPIQKITSFLNTITRDNEAADGSPTSIYNKKRLKFTKDWRVVTKH